MPDNKENKIKAGDANRITREYLDSLLLELRYIDSVVPSTKVEIFGQTYATPVMTAALSHLDRARPNGMVELAYGAKMASALMWAGMGEEKELEAMAETGAKIVRIIKPYADEDLIYRKIEHAKRTGVVAVGMDIDHIFDPKGRCGSVLGHDMTTKTLDNLKRYVQASEIPFVVKGVLSLQDAEKCLEAGVGGIVVSHHHGIQDYAIPPLMILPRIKKAVGDSMELFVDCGITSGTDAFKALALGAKAVSVGRVLIDFLVKDGAEGARDKIVSMTDELRAAMARTCSPDPTCIDPDVIWRG